MSSSTLRARARIMCVRHHACPALAWLAGWMAGSILGRPSCQAHTYAPCIALHNQDKEWIDGISAGRGARRGAREKGDG